VQALTYAIQRSCVNKAEVVAEDELEGGMRATLNLGHTFGHAIETVAGYGAPQCSCLTGSNPTLLKSGRQLEPLLFQVTMSQPGYNCFIGGLADPVGRSFPDRFEAAGQTLVGLQGRGCTARPCPPARSWPPTCRTD